MDLHGTNSAQRPKSQSIALAVLSVRLMALQPVSARLLWRYASMASSYLVALDAWVFVQLSWKPAWDQQVRSLENLAVQYQNPSTHG